jgi:hypothetical protein
MLISREVSVRRGRRARRAARSPWPHAIALFVFLLPRLAGAAMPERAIPPGQDALLATMLGRGETLPGGCRFAGGHVAATVVFGDYDCVDGAVAIELHDPAEAPSNAVRTDTFAIVVRSGTAPAELITALMARIQAHEAKLEWTQAFALQRQVAGLHLGSVSLAGIAAIILFVGLLVQYVVAIRHSAQEPTGVHLAASRGRVVALGELLRRRRVPRDRRILATLALMLAFLLSRLTFLTVLPAFVDESVHVHWAQSLWDRDFAAEFSVGRWLPVRIMALFVALPLDPLFAARLGSVAMGLAVLSGCMLINRELFSWSEGLLAGIVYTVLPYTLLYDRLALADIYLTAFGTWLLFFSILAARRRGLAPTLGMSLCMYAAILSKPTGGLFVVIPPLATVLLATGTDRAACLRQMWPTLVGGVTLLAFLIWAGYGTGLLTSQTAFEGRHHLMGVVLPNLEVARQWFATLLTTPVAIMAATAGAAALLGLVAGARAEALLALVLVVSVLPYTLVSRTWYPSYLLFAVVPISLLLGRAIMATATAASRVVARLSPRLALPTRRVVCVIGTSGLLAATAAFDMTLLTRPQDAPLPHADRIRYVSGGLSGYGLPELAAFLRTEAQRGPINVVRFDLVQPPKDGLDVYLTATDTLRLHSVDHRDERALAKVASLARAQRTLFVSNPEAERSLGIVSGRYLEGSERVWLYVRPGAQTRLEVWEVRPRRLESQVSPEH